MSKKNPTSEPDDTTAPDGPAEPEVAAPSPPPEAAQTVAPVVNTPGAKSGTPVAVAAIIALVFGLVVGGFAGAGLVKVSDDNANHRPSMNHPWAMRHRGFACMGRGLLGSGQDYSKSHIPPSARGPQGGERTASPESRAAGNHVRCVPVRGNMNGGSLGERPEGSNPQGGAPGQPGMTGPGMNGPTGPVPAQGSTGIPGHHGPLSNGAPADNNSQVG